MKDWKKRLEQMQPQTMKTLAELYGPDRLLVERHRGILSYSTECIRIGSSWGTLVVEGEGLSLCCMSRSQLVIRGRLRSLHLEGGT